MMKILVEDYSIFLTLFYKICLKYILSLYTERQKSDKVLSAVYLDSVGDNLSNFVVCEQIEYS
jgi:hypothetical protein